MASMARDCATPMDEFLARFGDNKKDEEAPPAMPPPHLQIPPLSRPLVPVKIISNLHADVAAQIIKYQSTAELPPFSITQLAVMLLIYYGPFHQYEIFQVIVATFPFYYDQAIGRPGSRAINQAHGPLTPHIQFHHMNDIFPEIQQFARSFAVPLLESTPLNLRINLREARFFLNECLKDAKPAASKPFRFLDLPAELRVRIYEYALAYPKSGVAVDIEIGKAGSQIYRPANGFVFTRDYDMTVKLSNCVSARGSQLHLPPLYKVLGLLQVSKLLYKEAMPVFFTQNKFVVCDVAMLRPFLERISIERRKCIQHLAVGYNEDGMHQAAAGFRLLKTTGLRHFELHVDEHDFDDIYNDRGVLLYTDMTRLPGFHTLRSHIKNLETLNVDGYCDTIREHFMKVLMASKAKEDQKKAKKGAGSKREVGAGQIKTKKKSKVKVEDEDEDGSL